MKLSLMTVHMMGEIIMKLKRGGSMEDARQEYAQVMELAKKSGFSAVDVTIAEVATFGLDYVKEMLDKFQFKVSSFIHFAPFTIMDEEACGAIIENAKKSIDAGIVLGTNVVMMVPLTHENILNYSRKDLVNQLIKNWIPVVEYATEKQVSIVIEDTPDLKIPLCTTEELQYVLNRIPNLKVVYDSGNMLLVKEDPVQYYKTFSSYIQHIHLKDMRQVTDEETFEERSIDGKKMKGTHHGEGLVDFKALLTNIKESGYNGYLTVEYVPEGKRNHEESLQNARTYLLNLI